MSEVAESRSNSQRIFQTIMDLTSANRVATRQVISSITGLKLSIVDDHIKRMKDDGKLTSPVNGVVEPVQDGEGDRAVSTTFLPNGRCKLEIGDIVIDLSMREARLAGIALGGIGIQFGR